MKWNECRPALKRRIQEQLKREKGYSPESGLRPAQPQQAPAQTLERRSREPKASRPSLALRVTVIVLRGKELDSHDNAKSACKWVVDLIADTLGVKDDDPRIEWNIEQLKSKTRRTLVVMETL